MVQWENEGNQGNQMKVWSLRPEKRGRPKGATNAMRVWHHTCAKLLARGLSDVEVARLLNKSPPTIRNFRISPAAQNLIAEMAKEQDAVLMNEVDYRLDLIRRAGTMAIERIVEKLEADEIDNDRTLLAIAADSSDRSGLGRASTQVNFNADVGTLLDKARERRVKVLQARIEGNVVKLIRSRI